MIYKQLKDFKNGQNKYKNHNQKVIHNNKLLKLNRLQKKP